jgi:hypothetical protein
MAQSHRSIPARYRLEAYATLRPPSEPTSNPGRTHCFSPEIMANSAKPQWRITMRRLLILLFPIFLLSTQLCARADGVSFGIPLPFPFLFYNFGQTYNAQPAYYYGGYYGRPYCAPGYYRRAYYYGGYYRPRYRSYQPGWYGYRWPGYYRPSWWGYWP